MNVNTFIVSVQRAVAAAARPSWSVQWKRDAESLYEVLERQVVSLFYDVDPATGVPHRWFGK